MISQLTREAILHFQFFF